MDEGEIRRLVTPLSPGRALDVGCGGGGNTAVLRDLGWRVAGLEYSPVGCPASAWWRGP